MKLLKLIPIKTLVKQLPVILAYVLTKVLMYVFDKYPSKTKVAIEVANDLTKAITQNIMAAEDGVIERDEVKKGIELWKEVFK